MPSPIDVSHPRTEGILQVAKSRKVSLLIDGKEMEDLLDHLKPFFIFDPSRPLDLEGVAISRQDFLAHWQLYWKGISGGKLIDEAPLRPFFSAIFTQKEKGVYAQKLSNGKYLIKLRKPAIQLQRHHFILGETFHSGVMGQNSITWGITFSYPQLFLDSETQKIRKVDKGSDFPNTELFSRLIAWVRNHTNPTPFVWKGKRINQPIRIGKNARVSINNHPDFQGKDLYVFSRAHP